MVGMLIHLCAFWIPDVEQKEWKALTWFVAYLWEGAS